MSRKIAFCLTINGHRHVRVQTAAGVNFESLESPLHSTTLDLSAQSATSADGETSERPKLLYPGFPVVSVSDYWREIPDRWLIWYARVRDEQ